MGVPYTVDLVIFACINFREFVILEQEFETVIRPNRSMSCEMSPFNGVYSAVKSTTPLIHRYHKYN